MVTRNGSRRFRFFGIGGVSFVFSEGVLSLLNTGVSSFVGFWEREWISLFRWRSKCKF